MAETCVVCGQPAPTDTRVKVGVRAVGGGLMRGIWTCGRDCRQQQRSAEAAQRRCLGFECNRWFTPSEGPGRPQRYHDDKCRKATDKALRRAQAAVVRGKVPSKPRDLEATIRLVEFLRMCWWGKRGEVLHGRPFPPVETPEPALVEATGEFLRRMHEELPQREADQRRAHDRNQRQKAADELERLRREGREADNAWRTRQLERLVAEADDAEEAGVL